MLCETLRATHKLSEELVLILVLMEYALRDTKKMKKYNGFDQVLILVLMEYALRVMNKSCQPSFGLIES